MTIQQIVVKGRDAANGQFRNIVHYDTFTTTPDTATIQEAIDDLDTKMKASIQPLMFNGIEIYEYEVRQVDVANLPSRAIVPTAGTWFGTGSGDKLPPQVSALITWKAYSVFPRTTRSYMFPFVEGVSGSGGTVTATAVAALETFAQAVLSLDVTVGTNWDKCAVRYAGDPRIVVDSNEVETFTVTNIWATMRSRKPGVGI